MDLPAAPLRSAAAGHRGPSATPAEVRRSLWTYHVNMRRAGRFIPREMILAAVVSYELIESYPDDKYLPSYLILARHGSEALHVLFATDLEGDDVRVVTRTARPAEWQADLKARRPNR